MVANVPFTELEYMSPPPSPKKEYSGRARVSRKKTILFVLCIMFNGQGLGRKSVKYSSVISEYLH